MKLRFQINNQLRHSSFKYSIYLRIITLKFFNIGFNSLRTSLSGNYSADVGMINTKLSGDVSLSFSGNSNYVFKECPAGNIFTFFSSPIVNLFNTHIVIIVRKFYVVKYYVNISYFLTRYND